MKKIMFNDRYGLTQAVLDGRKTQTRRIIPPSVVGKMDMPVIMIPKQIFPKDMSINEWVNEWLKQPNRPILVSEEEIPIVSTVDLRPSIIKLHSRYQVGEIVAIAQSYKNVFTQMDLSKRKGSLSDMITGAAWDNKMFVQADIMPHQIRITNVRMERLNDISDEDCLREGIYVQEDPKGYSYDANPGRDWKRWWFQSPRQAFAALIDKVSGRGTWDKNPWVFAYDFELVK